MTYAATILSFTDEEAWKVAEEIYEINYQIDCEIEEAEPCS